MLLIFIAPVLLRLSVQRSLILISCTASLIGAFSFAIHERALTSNAITSIATSREHVKVRGKVIRDPVLTHERVVGSTKRPRELTYLMRVDEVKTGEKIFHTRLPMRVFGGTRVELGETIEISGRISNSNDRRVSANISAQRVIQIRGPTRFTHFTSSLREKFRAVARTFHSDAAALIPGIVLGDISLQSAEFQKIMRRVGLTHITAVSGANFVLVATFMEWLLQWIFRREKTRLIITGGTLILFIFLVRPSPSVLRAAVMVAVVLIARSQRSYSIGIAALGCAVTTLLLLDPFQALEPGFALSVLATAGILFIAPMIDKYCEEKSGGHIPASLITALSVPLSATILCTPVIVAISGQLSLVTIPVNIAVAPLIAPITISGFISALLVPFFPEIARLLMIAVQPLAALIVWIARSAATLPSLHISLALLGIIFILFLALVVKFVRSKLFTLSVLAFVTLVAVVELPALIAFPTHNWNIFQCDVGQGDGLVYKTTLHHAIVIDAGPDPELIDRCLKRLRINVIDLLILTHSHADHVNGLPGILRGRRVQSVWANFDPGISHQQVFQGNTYVSPHVKISVLWPQQNNFSGPQLSGDGSTENNKSITVLMRSRSVNPSQEVTLLATGDIEPPAQAEIAKYFSSKITIIKVPHHGSRFQDFSWLAKVKPDIALISVGAGNSYGQPSLTTIAALTQLHTKVFRTDSDGAIEVGWSYDSAHLKIRIRREGHAWWKVRWV